jgi:hypothetical protein
MFRLVTGVLSPIDGKNKECNTLLSVDENVLFCFIMVFSRPSINPFLEDFLKYLMKLLLHHLRN